MASTESERRDFMLAAIRAAIVRVKLYDAELASIGVALKSGMIDCYTAVEWIKEIGALELVRIIPEEEKPNEGSKAHRR